MITIHSIEKAMRPQFVWSDSSSKLMQTSEVMEGSKDAARLIFVGVCDMYGLNHNDIMNHVQMGYDSFRYHLSKFREQYSDPAHKRFNVKVKLVLNAIAFANSGHILNIDKWLQHD